MRFPWRIARPRFSIQVVILWAWCWCFTMSRRGDAPRSRFAGIWRSCAANEDLADFNLAAVGRELRMIELKQEINAMCRQANQPPRYDVSEEGLV